MTRVDNNISIEKDSICVVLSVGDSGHYHNWFHRVRLLNNAGQTGYIPQFRLKKVN